MCLDLYVCVPYEQFLQVEQFHVKLMSDVVNELGLQGNNKVPDHSLLTWCINFTERSDVAAPDIGTGSYEHVSRPIYNTSNIPPDFLSSPYSLDTVYETIQNIERCLNQERDANSAYNAFTSLLMTKMDSILPKKRVSPSSRKKTRYKPYWSDDLQSAWDTVCEKERLRLRCRGSPVLKRRLRDSYNQQRKVFDKMNRCAKRKYQMAEQDRLKDMYIDPSRHTELLEIYRKTGYSE